ncbi:hypothetical protein PtA15_1A262 [Puccinia triticina]|uniref:DNA helicase n=1 Tax=Puccinia triticina TaxID=208348 RepID=A0ABY7C701_9BASI|nr:uncharacterized protein PtA15_1A262 [Puccinia triticina]WAQ80924.1 hypothetical protein PtA15_1A262 [Puccinia triticina]
MCPRSIPLPLTDLVTTSTQSISEPIDQFELRTLGFLAGKPPTHLQLLPHVYVGLAMIWSKAMSTHFRVTSRLLVTVRGALIDIHEFWDERFSVVSHVQLHVKVFLTGAPFAVPVRAMLKPIDSPENLTRGFYVGQSVQFQGYLDSSKPQDGPIFVKLMTNEIALPEDLSRRSPKLTLFEGAAVNVVYTNFQELRNCSRRDAALYMAERALFSSTPKTIRKLNMVIGKRHPANEVTLSAVELRDIPGFAMRTTRPVSSVTSMDRPDLHITLKIGAPVRLTKDLCLAGHQSSFSNFTRGARG